MARCYVVFLLQQGQQREAGVLADEVLLQRHFLSTICQADSRIKEEVSFLRVLLRVLVLRTYSSSVAIIDCVTGSVILTDITST
jgi:hypothetical protein